MHKQFTAWLRVAGLEPNDVTTPKHWRVINEFVPTSNEIISLARFFYGFGGSGNASLDRFGTALQDIDTNFSMQTHLRELSVFSGAELIATIERNQGEGLADLAALCLVCGGAQGARSDIPVPEMPKFAARYIEGRTSKRLSIPEETAEATADHKIEELKRELTIVSEETNMLWWLVSEYSRDLNQSWKKIGLSAASIVAGKELNDLTRVVPGPVAAPAFLDRIVRQVDSAKSSKPLCIKDAVEKVPRVWREQYPLNAPAGVEDLAPISNSVRLSLTVSEGANWSPVFEKGTGLDATSKMLPKELAYQVFLECMLVCLTREVR